MDARLRCTQRSFDDEWHEVGSEVRDAVSDLLNIIRRVLASTDAHSEVCATMELVKATDTVVLVFTYVRLVGAGLVESSPVKEEVGVKGASRVVCSPGGLARFYIKAESISLSHAVNEVLADDFTDALVSLLSKADLDDLRGEWAEHTLILHEGANIALLIPDEGILVSSFSFVEDLLQLLKGFRGPHSFDHSVFVQKIFLFIQSKISYLF